MSVRILQGDCRDVLKTLPDESVHCVVTSPPYWGLRDYGTATWEGGDSACEHTAVRRPGPEDKSFTNGGTSRDKPRDACRLCGARRVDSQLGLEFTPEKYVANLVAVFREVRRVLRDDGIVWINLGDSYAAQGGGKAEGQYEEKRVRGATWQKPRSVPVSLKPKDLVGIPWRVAFALQQDGWWLRSDIVWSKPNPMPESVEDRPTKAHEYIFLLAKSERYFYDADAIAEQGTSLRERIRPNGLGNDANKLSPLGYDNSCGADGRRNRRSVWTIATEPYPEAHFATFPTALVEPCILAGTSAKGCCGTCGAPWVRVVDAEANGGTWAARRETVGWDPTCACGGDLVPCTVLDPFGGSGTVGEVATALGRHAILIELNGEYVKLAERRTAQQGLFCQEATA